ETELDVVTAADRIDHGEVAVVGEGAAVVEGDGDGAGHGEPPGGRRRLRGYRTTSHRTVGRSVGSETTRRPSVTDALTTCSRSEGSTVYTISPRPRLAVSRRR